MITAGKLRHRITFEVNTKGRDPASGAVVDSWGAHATVWAGIEPLSVNALIAAQSTQSKISARILIRYRSDLTPDMRIVHGTKIYNPEGFLPDVDSGLEYLTIPCSEGVNNG